MRHLLATDWRTRRLFPDAALTAIKSEIRSSELRHGGEIRFALETALGSTGLWRGTAPRQRALEIFGQLGVWNTERNNGVLIYLLVADRDVEIVADRGFDGRVTPPQWEAICRDMEQQFRAGRFEPGAVAGVRGVADLIAQHFPAPQDQRNELPDRPVIL